MQDDQKKKLKLKVSAIKEGTVIDHIPAKDLFKVISILGLDRIENQVTFGSNLDSKKLGKKAIIKIVRNDNSPVIPTASSIYVGDFSVNQTVRSQFKVSVTDDAEEQTYPLDVLVNYENGEGEQVTSDVETTGIPVGKKIDFNITSLPSEISPGQKKLITVQYVNTGGAPAYNVQARISAVDPFTSSDDTAFLGTMAPGETREAAFEISVDKSATLKQYALDSEVRFRDALDNSMISDPMKVGIIVGKDNSPLGNPLVLAGIAAVIIVIGYAIYRQRTKKH